MMRNGNRWPTAIDAPPLPEPGHVPFGGTESALSGYLMIQMGTSG